MTDAQKRERAEKEAREAADRAASAASTAAAPEPPAPTTDEDAGRKAEEAMRQAMADERARVSEIRKLGEV